MLDCQCSEGPLIAMWTECHSHDLYTNLDLTTNLKLEADRMQLN